jgi:hypothetical protein
VDEIIINKINITGRSRFSFRKGQGPSKESSPKESEVFTESESELNEEDVTIDPKIADMFEHVR